MRSLTTGLGRPRLRKLSLLLALACAATLVPAGVAQANTITQTAITSPADPSYFYDPTAGAYGAITVTGTTNSTAPSSDQVDIYCYVDNGSTADPAMTSSGAYTGTLLAAGVALDSSGGFSTTIPYSAFENSSADACRLRAVPAGTAPTSGLASFAGPRVMIASLVPTYSFSSADSYLFDYTLTAPQLGAQDLYTSAGSPAGGSNQCGFSMLLGSSQYFGATTNPSFTCSDWYSVQGGASTNLQVDGQPAYGPAYGPYNSGPTTAVSVSASQNPSNGDMTVTESDPLKTCSSSTAICTSLGVTDERTIQQAASGRVVMITDRFISTDGASHTVTYDVASTVDNGVSTSGVNLFELPGQSGYSAYPAGSTAGLGSAAPGTIYAYNNPLSNGSAAGYEAITYFTAPSGPVSFRDANTPVIPYTLNIPAGGSRSLTIAYASEYSQQQALPADLLLEQDLYTPPAITIASPVAGTSVSSTSVTVSGSLSAVTGVRSVTVNGVGATVSGSSFSASVPLIPGANTITAVLTSNSGVTASDTEVVASVVPPAAFTPRPYAGALWLPVAATGAARRAGRHYERLSGRVTPGSGPVSYYFAYGSGGRFIHRTRIRRLPARKAARSVSATIGRLLAGRRYRYRLVVFGQLGRSRGQGRTFQTAALDSAPHARRRGN